MFPSPDTWSYPMTHEERRARRKEMADTVALGKMPYEVAAEYGCSLQNVREACRIFGVKMRPMLGSTQKFNSYKLLAELINTKDSFAELARKHNCTRQNVFHLYTKAREAGILVPVRHRGWERV